MVKYYLITHDSPDRHNRNLRQWIRQFFDSGIRREWMLLPYPRDNHSYVQQDCESEKKWLSRLRSLKDGWSVISLSRTKAEMLLSAHGFTLEENHVPQKKKT